MCGRYLLAKRKAKLARLLAVQDFPEWEASWNIAPTDPAPVLLGGGGRSVRLMRWGLVPPWARDLKIGARAINARCETVAEKAMFREAFAQRRAVVPADGFYEWKLEGGVKQPYAIAPQDPEDILRFAGLWERWHSPEGERVETFTIVTTAASATLSELHDRMPVVLAEDDVELWLQGEPERAAALMQPSNASLRVWRANRAVSNPRNDDPSMLTEQTQGSLF